MRRGIDVPFIAQTVIICYGCLYRSFASQIRPSIKSETAHFMSLFSFSSFFPLPLWKILLDSLFGVPMWLMMARFAVLIFISEQSAVPVLRHIILGGGSILRAMRLIIPGWLNIRAHDLYLAFLFFLIRYYVLPTLADYPLNTPGDMPMETESARLFRRFIPMF